MRRDISPVFHRQKAAKKALSLPPGPLKEINLAEAKSVPKWMTRAYRNNRYTVMIKDDSPTTHGPAIRAMVQKHDDKPLPFHWREMQKIKNELFGPEAVAVEYYPPESQLENSHNIYWMWIYPKGILPIPIPN